MAVKRFIVQASDPNPVNQFLAQFTAKGGKASVKNKAFISICCKLSQKGFKEPVLRLYF
jgi:hypothetical protein